MPLGSDQQARYTEEDLVRRDAVRSNGARQDLSGVQSTPPTLGHSLQITPTRVLPRPLMRPSSNQGSARHTTTDIPAEKAKGAPFFIGRWQGSTARTIR